MSNRIIVVLDSDQQDLWSVDSTLGTQIAQGATQYGTVVVGDISAQTLVMFEGSTGTPLASHIPLQDESPSKTKEILLRAAVQADARFRLIRSTIIGWTGSDDMAR